MCDSGARISVPEGAFEGLSDPTLNMVALYSVDDPNAFIDEAGESTSISGMVSLTFYSPNSRIVSAVSISNLSTPFLLTIPHAPLGVDNASQCRWWDPTTREQRTEGCEVDVNASHANQTVCACNHLTDFTVGFTETFELLGTMEALAASDFEALTWEQLIVCEEALGAIICFISLYLLFLPFALKKDRDRHRNFKSSYVYELTLSYTLSPFLRMHLYVY